jgi:transcriptional regulator with XRE-family HTH domain
VFDMTEPASMGQYRPMTEPSASELTPLELAMARAIKGEAAYRDISKGELAQRSGIPMRTMRRYLSGERSITLGALARFADALGLTLDELIEKAREREKQ